MGPPLGPVLVHTAPCACAPTTSVPSSATIQRMQRPSGADSTSPRARATRKIDGMDLRRPTELWPRHGTFRAHGHARGRPTARSGSRRDAALERELLVPVLRPRAPGGHGLPLRLLRQAE